MNAPFTPTIEKAKESKLAWAKILVMGLSGAGKTTFLATASKALILQVEEQGIHSIRAMNPDADVIHITSWDHLASVMVWIRNQIQAKDFPYRTVCLDSFHDAQGLFEAKLVQGSKDKIRLSRDEYGLLGSRSLMMLDMIKRLPRHFIVVTKAQEFQDGDELKIRPGGVGQVAPNNMAYHFNVVAYAYKRIPEDGGRPEYLLLTDGSDKFITKGHPSLNPIEIQNADAWLRKILEGGKAGVLTPAEASTQDKPPPPPKPPKEKKKPQRKAKGKQKQGGK